jgi:hypothetical protein
MEQRKESIADRKERKLLKMKSLLVDMMELQKKQQKVQKWLVCFVVFSNNTRDTFFG